MTGNKVKVGDLKNINGPVTVTGGDNTTINEAFSPSAEAAKARKLEVAALGGLAAAFRQGLIAQAAGAATPSKPYQGLVPYGLAESGTFFGREEAAAALLELMQARKFGVLQAESGAGKTSLLQAGVLPQLLKQNHLPISLRLNGSTPGAALKAKILRDLRGFPNLGAGTLRDFLTEIVQALADHPRLYIIIDQFEEFFEQIDEERRRAFINELGECLDDPSLDVHWLISLRSEYFGRLADFSPTIPDPFGNVHSLRKLDRAQAAQTITRPAEKFGLSFEDGLVDLLLDDLGRDEIAPTQMQIVCSALAKSLPAGQTSLTLAAYRQAGAARGILRDHLGNALKAFPGQQAAVRKVLEALISSVPRRKQCPYNELSDYLSSRGVPRDELNVILQKLTDERLVSSDLNMDGPVYELAHDYLLDEIRIDPQVKRQKQAEELLEQGLRNWQDHNILLSSDAVGVIEKQRDNLYITAGMATLMFLSALSCGKDADFWLKRISPAQAQIIIERYAHLTSAEQPEQRLFAQAVLTKLHKDLSPTLKRQERLWRAQKLGTRALKLLPGLIGFFFIGLIVLGVVWINSLLIPPFPRASQFDVTCLDGAAPVNPLVAVDPDNTAHMVGFDSGKQVVCQSFDSAYSWQKMPALPASAGAAKQLVANKKIYLVSPAGLYVENDGGWKNIYPSLPGQEVSALASDPQEPQVLFVARQDNHILKSTDGGENWNESAALAEQFGQERIIALSTAGAELVAAGTQNIWFRSTENSPWEHYDLRLNGKIVIQDVELIKAGETVSIYALINGLMYLGYLHEKSGLTLWPENAKGAIWPENMNSLSIYNTAVLAGSRAGVFCSQSWHLTDLEWWRWKLNWRKPCQ